MHKGIEKALAIAIVRIGMSMDDFYRITPNEWNGILEEYRDWEEAMMRERWEQTRQISYCSIAHVLEKGTKIQRFQPFSWDRENDKTERPTEEEIGAMIEFFGEE